MKKIFLGGEEDMTPHFISFLLACITGGLGVIIWFVLRELLLTMLFISKISPWAWAAIQNFSLVFVGIIWLGLFYLTQLYYENAIKKKTIFRSLAFVLSIELFLLFVCQLIPLLLGITGNHTMDYIIVIAEAVATTFLVYFFIQYPRMKIFIGTNKNRSL